MSDLDITADGEHRYAADVTDDTGQARRYSVRVPTSLLDSLGLGHADEPLLVRAALDLLLDKPGARMGETFDLDEAEASYPGFLAEIKAAVGR